MNSIFVVLGGSLVQEILCVFETLDDAMKFGDRRLDRKTSAYITIKEMAFGNMEALDEWYKTSNCVEWKMEK